MMRVKVAYPTNPEGNDSQETWVDILDSASTDDIIAYLQGEVDGPKLPKVEEKGRSIEWQVVRVAKRGDPVFLREGDTLLVSRIKPRPPVQPASPPGR